MSEDLLRQLRQVCATLAAMPHDPALSAAGRCQCLTCRCERLASRGWPASTMGDGIRSSDNTSPTERAVGARDPFAALSDRLGVHLGEMQTHAIAVLAIAAAVDSHASDEDIVPPGTGFCACGCGHKCDPRKNPSNRLRSKLGPACYRRWLRWREAYPGYGLTDFIAACYRERGESYAKPVAPPAEPRAS